MLDDDIELLLPHLPGREDRFGEPAIDDIEMLVAELRSAMPPPDLPVVLFGHGTGAFVAYELAVQLQTLGHPPRLLIVSAARPPHEPPPTEQANPAADDQLLSELRTESPWASLLDDPDLVELMLPTIKADVALGDGYHRRDPIALASPVVAYAGADDGPSGREDALAWQRCAAGPFEVAMFPGGHYFIDTARHTLI